jgi:hypothetical protein
MTHKNGDAPSGARLMIAGAIVLVLACVVSVWAAHWLVDRIYAGELLPNLFTNRTTQPIEHYYQKVTPIVVAAYLLVGLVGALLYARRFRSAWLLLGLLWAGDLVFCILSEIYGGMLSVRLDGGVPEWFQYLKEITLAVLLIRLSKAPGRQVFFAWGLLFAFLFVDDAFRYHERVGVLAAHLPFLDALAARLEVRAVDLGEMIGVGPLVLAFLVSIAVYFFRAPTKVRRAVVRLGLLFGGLVFFGGVMDLVDRVAVTRGSNLAGPLSLLEDGGEMMVMSAMLAYAAYLTWLPRDHWLEQRGGAAREE